MTHTDDSWRTDQLRAIEQRLAELDEEEAAARAGTHPSVVAGMAEGHTRDQAAARTLTVITNIRQHLRLRQQEHATTDAATRRPPPPAHRVLRLQLVPEERARLQARARREHKRLQRVFEEEVWALRQALPEALDGHLMWVLTPEDIILTITTVPWHGVRPEEVNDG